MIRIVVLSALALASAPAWANELVAEAARAIVERSYGAALGPGAVTKQIELGGRAVTMISAPGGPLGRGLLCYVRTDGTRLAWTAVGLSGIPKEGPPPSLDRTEEYFVSVARAVARRTLGATVEEMEWRIGWRDVTTVQVEGRTLLGDPPREGLGPRCEVAFRRHIDEPVEYIQSTPEPEEPLPVSITADEALERGYADLGRRDVDVCGLELWQGRGRVYWAYLLKQDGHLLRGYSVDSATGEIIAMLTASGATERGATRPSGRRAPGLAVLPVAGAGGVLMVCIVAVVVLRRRR